jgi:outer membrane lipoprotein-sorting protein
MTSSETSRLLGVTCGIALAATLVSAAPQQAQTPPAQNETAQQRFKNVQVLKDIPASQLNPTMHLIAGQLGVGCQYCHVWEQWEREDVPQKQVARRMFAMVQEINRSTFGAAPLVTCYTCHRGQPKPVNTVVLPVSPPPRFDAPKVTTAPVALPSVDEILGKYVRALGGEAAFRKLTTLKISGTQDIPTGPGGIDATPADVEIYRKAPNLLLKVYRTASFAISDGFDGTVAWSQNAAGTVVPLQNPDQDRERRNANFYEALALSDNYSAIGVTGIEKVGTRDAYVIVGVPGGDSPERLYFDTQTGLLLRRATYAMTPLGQSPYQVDFDDYRDVAGIRIPFVVQMTPATQHTELGTKSTLRVTKVESNVAIDDSRFAKPSGPRPAAPSRR